MVEENLENPLQDSPALKLGFPTELVLHVLPHVLLGLLSFLILRIPFLSLSPVTEPNSRKRAALD